MSELLGAAYKLRNAANRTARINAEVALLCEYALNAADTMEAEHARLRDELREKQELCDDLSGSVIAAAFLAPHNNGAKDLLEETIGRMKQRARRKVGAGDTALEVHGTVFFKDNHQYRSQLRFPVADGAYELVKIENPDITHPLFHVAGESFEVAASDKTPNEQAQGAGGGLIAGGSPGAAGWTTGDK